MISSATFNSDKNGHQRKIIYFKRENNIFLKLIDVNDTQFFIIVCKALSQS